MTDGETFTAIQVCDIAGITYRQLDYWARTDVLIPSARPAHGSGSRRLYSIADMRCAVVLAALSREGSYGGGYNSGSWIGVRRLVVDAYRQRPWAEFIVVLDGTEVELCDTVEEAVTATHRASCSTIIWPDRIIWPDHDIPSGAVTLSAEPKTSPPGASAAPAASSRPHPVASAALSP